VVETGQEPDRLCLVGFGLDRVLADDVERGQLPVLHGIEHRGEVLPALRRDGHAPRGVERGAQRILLHVLEAG
jgi:hypothetical protein